MNHRRLVPEGSIIDLFMETMSDLETPTAYDFWCGMWLLSCAVGRDVLVDRPRIPVHLNTYIILIGESGVTRKSTAVSRAVRLYHQFVSRIPTRYLTVETRAVPEAFETMMHNASAEYGYCNAVIAVSELVTLLGRQSYNVGWPGILTDIYDCPSTRISPGSSKRGPTQIKNVYATLLAASAPSWLARSIHPDIIEGGFTSRVVFAVGNRRKRVVSWPEERDTDDIEEKIINRLVEIHNQTRTSHVSRRIKLTPGAMKRFKSWYQRRSMHNDPFRTSFEAREDDHVLRTAALLCISDNRYAIDLTDLNSAIRLISEAKEAGASIFETAKTSDKFVIGIERIRNLLISSGLDTLSSTELYNEAKNYLKASEFRAVMDVMHELGLVQQFESPEKRRGPKRKLWRGTKALYAKDLVSIIKKELDK